MNSPTTSDLFRRANSPAVLLLTAPPVQDTPGATLHRHLIDCWLSQQPSEDKNFTKETRMADGSKTARRTPGHTSRRIYANQLYAADQGLKLELLGFLLHTARGNFDVRRPTRSGGPGINLSFNVLSGTTVKLKAELCLPLKDAECYSSDLDALVSSSGAILRCAADTEVTLNFHPGS
ncbi:hypothetical protein CSKR_100138 [Clonorchis sinensis]|uniref:Uncharacterized protein n=1 Tax=Clonorchis sinensis TaxID=79923 RepID=A0A419PPS1_CLOSI|nr:hypothetical protein CSKR_100138 [Clonorchis sinensis]